MKVLQVNKFLKIVGGAETYMFELSKALQAEGIEVKFWGMEDEENITDDFSELLVENINYADQGAVKKISSVAKTIYSKSNRRKIAKVLDDFAPDIVHIHNYNFQITPSILPEIKKRNIKVVQTIHDSQMVCPYHRLYNFQRNTVCTKCIEGSFNNCIKDKCFDGSLLKSAVGAIESKLYHALGYYEKHVDCYISPSNFLANLINKRIKKEIKVIPNFTSIEKGKQKNINPLEESYYLYFGRISEEKGIKEMISLFNRIDLNLIVVGKGPLEKWVEESISDSKNIKFIGPKYGEELVDIIENAKYVIQPSKWFENCPMTIIESFALDVPVIGSNHSGFKDLINDGETGFLLDFNDPDEDALRLKTIDKQDTENLKKNISEHFNNNLAKHIHINKIISIYDDLTNKKSV